MRRLAQLWRALNLPCRDMTALLSRALDERLPWHERCARRLHLLYCRACRRYARQLRIIRDALRRIADAGDAAAALTPEARARIEEALRK